MQTVSTRLSSNTSSPVVDWHGGNGTFFASGNFASGSAVLESSIDGGVTWTVCKDSSNADLELGLDGIISFSLGSCKLRVTLSGSTEEAGTSQWESLICTGGDLEAGGLLNVIVTASGMAGSPLTVPVRVENGDSLFAWVEKIRDGLNARAEVSAMFDVESSDDTIILKTRPPYAANDPTLNLELASELDGADSIEGSTDAVEGVVTTPNILVSVQRR